MKKSHILRKILYMFLCVLILIPIGACSLIELSYRTMEKSYYSDKNNFVEVTALCESLYLHESGPRYYINVKNMTYEKTDSCEFSDYSFVVNRLNSVILKEADIEKKITPGTTFKFVSAPRYFGDGYDCPIVAIEVDGEVLLDFETGYKNFMKKYFVRVQ